MNIKSSSGRHGDLRGLLQVTESSTRSGRFGRLFRHLPPAHDPSDEADVDALTALGHAMKGEGPDEDKPLGEPDDEENPDIPAGYTYLGQFIDHDLTFDPVSSFTRQNDPEARTNFRTPRFDLDSVYGRGPLDQPYLYQDGVKLLLGQPLHDSESPNVSFDLPRNRVFAATGQEVAEGQRALTGDPRNDENRIVSQLHSLFLEFHNAQVAKCATKFSGAELFTEAQRLTRWHYQWIVLHDFLPKITGKDVALSLISTVPWKSEGLTGQRTRPELLFYQPRVQAYMPVEFSAAAYRFGHSMVRPSYHFNHGVRVQREGKEPDRNRRGGNRVPILDFPGVSLAGRRPMPLAWAFDWDFFFQGRDGTLTQPSYRIDTQLSEPLEMLQKVGVVDDDVSSLAVRNLRRGAQLGLPSGEDVATFMGLTPLSTTQLYDEQETARKVELDESTRKRLEGRTPLWYYILREAEHYNAGTHLGPVGGRLVGEVIVGLMFEDKHSFVNVAPDWSPSRESTTAPSQWGMPELVEVVRQARKNGA